MVEQDQPLLGSLLRRMVNGINRVAQSAAVGVFGSIPAPPPINNTQVAGAYDSATNTLTVPGEIVHFVHTHNVPLQRGVQYITEISANDPNFSAPHPVDTGASRSGFVTLPTNDSTPLPVTYYLRGIVQYHGSLPSEPTVFGGSQGPTKIVLSGLTAMTLLPSQAAGTAKPGQGGQGIGLVQSRGAVGGPKRTV